MSDGSPELYYLTVDVVVEIHGEALGRFGGADGVRDLPLLESAVAGPQATFDGESVYADVVEIAAAYLFYLCRNHAFVDGNKRVALGACLVFLRLNGVVPPPDGPKWVELTLAVAASELDRVRTTARLRLLLEDLGV